MHGMQFIMTITARHLAESFIEFFRSYGISVILSSFGNGTASQKVLDYLGLEDTERCILFSVSTEKTTKALMKNLVYQMRIDIPGNGIALAVPVDSVGGNVVVQYMIEGQENHLSEGIPMNEVDFELIVVVANKGYTDTVMEAAHAGGASGGTVIHAKGTDVEHAEKFFGMSIAAEKEMIFIVARKQEKPAIMKAIVSQAGLQSKARSIVFSLPVSDVVGLRLPPDPEE